jgi:hypothetical protein
MDGRSILGSCPVYLRKVEVSVGWKTFDFAIMLELDTTGQRD